MASIVRRGCGQVPSAPRCVTFCTGLEARDMLAPWSFRTFAESLSRGIVLRRTLPKKEDRGATLFVPPEVRPRYWSWSLASSDPWLLDMAVELVSRGEVVWVIGANVGLFSFAAAGLAGPSA
jgi:hypothetical protein